jgi:hypothetical protein
MKCVRRRATVSFPLSANERGSVGGWWNSQPEPTPVVADSGLIKPLDRPARVDRQVFRSRHRDASVIDDLQPTLTHFAPTKLMHDEPHS